MTSIASTLVQVVNLINFLVFVWVALSWVPNIRWYEQPFKALDQIVQPLIAPFRKVIPPIANFDFSPVIAMLTLQLVAASIQHFIGGY